MGVPESVKRLLVCPVCKGDLLWRDTDAVGGVKTGSVVECRSCGRVYPFDDGIPVLLGGRAMGRTG